MPNTSRPEQIINTLFQAIKKGDENEIERLINENKIDLDCHGIKGHTPLTYLAEQEQLEEEKQVVIANLLIQRGAKLETTHISSARTALHSAAIYGRARLCQVFIEAGANLEATNQEGTPLIAAAKFPGNAEVIRLLTNHNAEVDAITAYSQDTSFGGGESALHWAVITGQAENAELLVKAKADLRKRTRNDYCILHMIDVENKALLTLLGLQNDVKTLKQIQQSMVQLQDQKVQKFPPDTSAAKEALNKLSADLRRLQLECSSLREKLRTPPTVRTGPGRTLAELESDLEDVSQTINSGDVGDRITARMTRVSIQQQIEHMKNSQNNQSNVENIEIKNRLEEIERDTEQINQEMSVIRKDGICKIMPEKEYQNKLEQHYENIYPLVDKIEQKFDIDISDQLGINLKKISFA